MKKKEGRERNAPGRAESRELFHTKAESEEEVHEKKVSFLGEQAQGSWTTKENHGKIEDSEGQGERKRRERERESNFDVVAKR